jgi:hypothetical protein
MSNVATIAITAPQKAQYGKSSRPLAPMSGFQGLALGGSSEGGALWWGSGAKPLTFLPPPPHGRD